MASKQLAKRRKRQKRQWGMHRIRGENWISEERVECEYGWPRELMACWSTERDVPIPTTYRDRRIRRHVLLAAWAREVSLSEFPVRVVNEEVLIARDLEKDMVRLGKWLSDLKSIEPRLALRAQLLALTIELAIPDYERALTEEEDVGPMFYKVLEKDIRDPVPVGHRQITEEWDRYYETFCSAK